MTDFQTKINKEFSDWKQTPPNAIQRGMGIIGKPLEFLLNPFISKITPLLEKALIASNNAIADAINSASPPDTDVRNFTEKDFIIWLNEKDEIAKKWQYAGITLLTTAGGAGGFLGFAALAAEIPLSFTSLLAFANKISVTYALDITDKNVQAEILKAITAGSATSADTKLEIIGSFSMAATLINKTTWKAMKSMAPQTMGGIIHTIRNFLQKLGVNITKRKAAQLIPGLGAVTGAAINASWASDSLIAVREYSRYLASTEYYKNK